MNFLSSKFGRELSFLSSTDKEQKSETGLEPMVPLKILTFEIFLTHILESLHIFYQIQN